MARECSDHDQIKVVGRFCRRKQNVFRLLRSSHVFGGIVCNARRRVWHQACCSRFHLLVGDCSAVRGNRCGGAVVLFAAQADGLAEGNDAGDARRPTCRVSNGCNARRFAAGISQGGGAPCSRGREQRRQAGVVQHAVV